jgi:tetratricopeptide (TPR) repeat protein
MYPVRLTPFPPYMLLNFSAFTRLKRCVGLWGLLLGALLPVVSGQAPLVTDQVDVLDADQQVLFEWQVDAADRALGTGLVVLAEGLYRDLLEVPGVVAADRAQLQVQLAASLIAQRRFVAAQTVLKTVSEAQHTDAYHLYVAVCAYGSGRTVDLATLNAALAEVSEAALKPEELPWLYLLRGLLAEFSGRPEQVVSAFQHARSVAVSELQRAFFDSLLLRQEILQAPDNDALATEVRGQWELHAGTAAAYPYARQYAILLHHQGRTEEAIELITAELANVHSGYGGHQREQLLLLKGMLYGADTLSGRDALRALVREGRNRDVMAVALQLLAQAESPLERAELIDFLKGFIPPPGEVAEPESKPHPLLGQMYYIRSQLALASGATAEAEADAALLLEQFPGLSEITNVYRLLAYAALQRRPAQYRAAADYLIQLRDQAEALESRQTLNRLIGDCYFLNNDYRNAIDFYQAARYKGVGVDHNGALFLRLVTAQVRGGQIEAALQQIDEADFSGSVSSGDRWRAEWNVALALQSAGQLEAALTRVRLILGDQSVKTVSTALELRLRWLEARLAWMAGDTTGVLERVDQLLERIRALPEDVADPSPAELRLLRTEALLLQADILMGTGDSAAGMEVLSGLRTGYAESSAAERSYLTEADYHASIGDFEAAQATLLKLASLYESSELAPQALFEAALYCERRGPAQFAAAVRVHHDLTVRYPTDRLLFVARLKQGDLLRQMNKFADAQKIYEDLIHSFPEHPRRYVAELSRADSMLALAKDNEEQLKDVALALERLMDMPNLPVDFQAEVGYKWGFSLLQRGALAEAQKIFTMIASQFLLDGENATRLGRTGRYWMSRALLELGAGLEASGELAEARRVYRKMVAYNLPGRNLAQSRANRLPVVEE